MAEIKITEKRGSWLPWVFGVVLLGALIWFVAMRGTPDATTAERTGAYDTNSAAGTLAAPRDSAVIRTDTMQVPPAR
ncbi:hypothetical protein [Gemmatimonas sp.]|uniref:hypothetical protein n=1 Tax=Gemmatimonas sp. TaxID=1962908 RepID=UPI00286C8BE0|nr:hypothetical protein [Gemmatimonas sp.]